MVSQRLGFLMEQYITFKLIFKNVCDLVTYFVTKMKLYLKFVVKVICEYKRQAHLI